MTISSNIHDVTSMTANHSKDTSWITIETKDGHALVFMPRSVVEATATAFAEATALNEAAT